MGRDQTALSWLRRYDALLRERDEESRREQVVREIMKAKEDVLPPSFHLSRPEDPLGRRKRTARETLVPMFLPREVLEARAAQVEAPEPEPVAPEPVAHEPSPEPRMFDRAERASGVVPRHTGLREAFAEPDVAEAPPPEAPAAVDDIEVELEGMPEALAPDPEVQAAEPPVFDAEPWVISRVVVPLEALAPAVVRDDVDEGPEDASVEISAALSFREYARERETENETTDGVPAVDEEPPSLPELSLAAAHAWSSIPPAPADVDDATTDAMAMPPAFTRPPPRITVLGPPPMDETTEPLDMSFPHEAPLPIDLSPLGLSPLGVSMLSPVAPVETSSSMMLSPPPPPAPRRVLQELSPPPLAPYRRMPMVEDRPVELTPPSLPLANANAGAGVDPPVLVHAPAPLPVSALGPVVEPIPLPTFDLKNPWAAPDEERSKTAEGAPRPSMSERLAPWKPAFRTLSLALLAATVGISVRGALALRANGPDAHAPSPVGTTTTLQAPVAPVAPVMQAAPVAPAPATIAPPAQAAEAALAAKVQGTLEIVAPADVPVVVDGIERGRGPKVTIQLGTGYHMVRVGTNVTQLVQVRAKQTSTMDVTKSN